MLNLQSLEFLSEYNLNLPIWGISFLFAYILVLIFALEKATRKGVSRKDIFNLVNIVSICGIVGARVIYLVVFQTNLDWASVFSFSDIFYDGKLSVVGGYLAGFLSGWFYLQGFDVVRRSGMSWLRFFDAFLPIALIGMIFAYIGIFFITVNKGAISSVEYPWSIMFNDNYVHPWALYIALGYLLLFSIISILYDRFDEFRKPGYLTYCCLIGISLIHFITDFWQTTDLKYGLPRISGLTITQLMSLATILIITVGLIFVRTKNLSKE